MFGLKMESAAVGFWDGSRDGNTVLRLSEAKRIDIKMEIKTASDRKIGKESKNG